MAGHGALDARGLDEGPLFGSWLGVTRTHAAWTAAILIAAFVVVMLGRVVLDAAAASARVDQLREANAELRLEVEALAAEKELLTSPIFVQLAGRGQGYGSATERAFGLAPGAPPPRPLLVEEAGAVETPGPLEAWLTLLLGP